MSRLRRMFQRGRRLSRLIKIPLALLIGRVRSRHQILSVWPPERPALGPRVVLFMHFDGKGAVRQQVLHYLRDFKANGREIVFVTNSGRLRPEAQADLQELCSIILVRRNIGYDFGAWADALDHLGLPLNNTQEVIFANDSVFGPLLPLKETLQRLDYTQTDIWGLTESWQQRYHLQSFFLAFGPRALRAKCFATFWRGVRPVPMKSYIVREYEIGITQAMIKNGLRCTALWPYEQLTAMAGQALIRYLEEESPSEDEQEDPVQKMRATQLLRIRIDMARRVPMNPTADLWRQLLQSGFPFIKRELLRENPTGVNDISEWADIVREELGVDPDLVRRELRLMLKGQAP